jgi:hypothetical protein
MTSGAQASVTEREGKSNGSGGRGKRAVGCLRSRAEFGPQGLLIFSYFLSLFFSVFFLIFV